HPQSGWFEDTPLKGGPEEGCPLKGVHEGIFLLRLGSMCGTTFELLSSHRGIVCPLAVALRIALGVVVVLEAGLSHKTSSAPPQRRNGRAFSSLTARGGGLPFGVSACPIRIGVRAHGTGRSSTEEVSIRSDGRAMGDRGTAAPARQAEPTRRAPAEGQH